jgi:thiamine-phosphate pyrophosphorylase
MDCSVYLATPATIPALKDCLAILPTVLAEGVDLLQLRVKHVSDRTFYELALAFREITVKFDTPLLINDRIDIMLAADADGVHIGRDDLPIETARRLTAGRILGYSANQPSHFRTGEHAQVDYFGTGPVFATQTKENTGPVLGLEGLRTLAQQTSTPVVAIGGITPETFPKVMNLQDVNGCCLISSIWNASNPAEEVKKLRHHTHTLRNASGNH